MHQNLPPRHLKLQFTHVFTGKLQVLMPQTLSPRTPSLQFPHHFTRKLQVHAHLNKAKLQSVRDFLRFLVTYTPRHEEVEMQSCRCLYFVSLYVCAHLAKSQ